MEEEKERTNERVGKYEGKINAPVSPFSRSTRAPCVPPQTPLRSRPLYCPHRVEVKENDPYIKWRRAGRADTNGMQRGKSTGFSKGSILMFNTESPSVSLVTE